MNEIKEAFEKLVQVPDAWSNPMMQPVKNGFILGWEAAVLAEREACAKVCEEGTALTAFQSKDCYSYARNRAAAIRARGNDAS